MNPPPLHGMAVAPNDTEYEIQIETGQDSVYQFGSTFPSRTLGAYIRYLLARHSGHVVADRSSSNNIQMVVTFEDGASAAQTVLYELHQKIAPRMFGRNAQGAD